MYTTTETGDYYSLPLQQVDALGELGLDLGDVVNPQVSSLLLDKETIRLIDNIFKEYPHEESAQSH